MNLRTLVKRLIYLMNKNSIKMINDNDNLYN